VIENPVDPAHYKKPGGIEVIDFIEAICADLPGDEAALVMPLVKYISRYRQKHPENPVRDLKKGLWFLDRLIKMVEAKQGEDVMRNLTQVRTKADTDGWRDDYSNKGSVRRVCPECKSSAEPGKPLHHWMSCSEYTGHF
jgi:hypothetical protein